MVSKEQFSKDWEKLISDTDPINKFLLDLEKIALYAAELIKEGHDDEQVLELIEALQQHALALNYVRSEHG